MAIQVKIKSSPKIKVRTQIATPESLSGVDNVDIDNIQDGYVLMYDDQRQRYAFVDPDVLLSKSVEDEVLPQDFVDQLDVDLNNKIDFDGGSF